jgi:two-component system OmpR family response regulator
MLLTVRPTKLALGRKSQMSGMNRVAHAHREVGSHRYLGDTKFYSPLESFGTSAGLDRQAKRVLLVEDDWTMQRMVASYLEDHSFHVAATDQGADATRQLLAGDVDLVLLDLVLGDDDGLDVLRDIRRHSTVPVIIITGRHCDEADKVVGLALGADDYVTKPFSLRELLARVRAVLRGQAAGLAAAARQPGRGRCRFGDWQLDCRSRQLRSLERAPVELTNGEYRLLAAFLDAPRRVLTREDLLQATRVHEDVFDRSIDVQILRLRRKLEANPSAPQIIRTERGVGYVFGLAVDWLP